MNCKDVQQELSAYFDGESDEADAVREHLTTCPGCARAYHKLGELSRALHALPSPEPSYAFATRVEARIREEAEHARSRGISRWIPVGMAAAAMVLIGGAVLVHSVWTANPTPTQVASSTPSTKSLTMTPRDTALALAIENQLAQGAELPASAYWSEEDNVVDGNAHDYPNPAIVLARQAWFPAFSQAVDATANVDELIESLTPEERAAFKELLSGYLKGKA